MRKLHGGHGGFDQEYVRDCSLRTSRGQVYLARGENPGRGLTRDPHTRNQVGCGAPLQHGRGAHEPRRCHGLPPSTQPRLD
jgi:hypothetical protein